MKLYINGFRQLNYIVIGNRNGTFVTIVSIRCQARYPVSFGDINVTYLADENSLTPTAIYHRTLIKAEPYAALHQDSRMVTDTQKAVKMDHSDTANMFICMPLTWLKNEK